MIDKNKLMDERNDYNSIPMQPFVKTAVEWLVKQLNQKIDFIPMDKWDEIKDIVQQAKQMEKEQIIEAYCEGNNDISAEQYYNQTYNQNK